MSQDQDQWRTIVKEVKVHHGLYRPYKKKRKKKKRRRRKKKKKKYVVE
jgi:hypothetical protein